MSATDSVVVSVVIPTHNRHASLRRTLDALAHQTYLAERMEVVVVADGCSDATAAMVHAYRAPYALQLLEQDSAGAAAARNRGAAVANGRLLVFLDDDIEPSRELVEAHVAAHPDGEEHLSLGPSLPVLTGRLDFYRMELRAWWLDFFSAMHEPGYRFTFHSLAAGNCAIDGAVFARLGGFDTRIRSCGGEDWEFGLRLMKAGVPFTYVHAARANHYDGSDLSQSLRRKQQEGRADVIIGSRHPELRSSLALARLDAPHSRLGWVLRGLVFTAPAAGDEAARRLHQLLHVLEQARLRRRWRTVHRQLNDYWYWRGVVDELGSREALNAFLLLDGVGVEKSVEIDIDLAAGLCTAERRLDAERPAGVVLHYAGQRIGRIPAAVGAESIRGAHLRARLATSFSDRLLKVLAIEAATGSILHPDWHPFTRSRAFSR